MADKSLADKNPQSFIVFNLIADVLAEHPALQAKQLKHRTWEA